VAEEAPAKPKRVRRKKADAAPVEAVVEVAPAEPVAEEAPAKPKRVRRKKADAAPVEAPVEAAPAEVAVEAAPVETPTEATPAAEDDASASPRRGWWQRTFGE